MAARIGNLMPGQQLSTVGVPVDNRRDMARELMAAALIAQLSAAEGVLKQIVETGETKTDRKAARDAVSARTPSPVEVQRALANIQREHGLPVTGRFDESTAVLLQRLGLVPTLSPTPTTTTSPPTTTAPTAAPAKPTTSAPTTTTTSAPTTTAPPASERKPVDPTTRQQTRDAVNARDAQLKTMLTAKGFTAPSSSSTPSKPLDRVLDPARLMASLFAGGIVAPNPQAALSTFQGLVGLPPTGQLDPKTMQALVATNRLPPSTADAKSASPPSTSTTSTSTSAAPAKASTTSATNASSAQAVRETKSTSAGSGASTTAATSAATMKPAPSAEVAREQARLESLLAQAAATERGVQESTGDPVAVVGHGEVSGAATGLTGEGGEGSVADVAGTEVAVLSDQLAVGDESSVGNTKAGDDDHHDERRGEAVDAKEEAEVDDDVIPDGHYKVDKLSVQVAASLKDIARFDDGTVPVHYTWDVTLYRPGVYADGQPAEAVWHLVVERAHAFDPVWSTAMSAIALRLLNIEPDAQPPSLEALLGALRQARVR